MSGQPTDPARTRQAMIPPGPYRRELLVGIYCLKNTQTGECYVGQSGDMETRVRGHMGQLRRGKHHSHLMQVSYDVHGRQAFTHEYLDFAPDAMNKREREQWLNEKEALFIRLFRPAFNVVSAPMPLAVPPKPLLVLFGKLIGSRPKRARGRRSTARRSGWIPGLCHHKGQQRGYVTVDGKELYFRGRWPIRHKRAPQEIMEQYKEWRLKFLKSQPGRPKKA